MLITNYRDYLAVRTQYGYSTSRFNTLIGIGAQTKYAWKSGTQEMKTIYKLMASLLSERPQLVEQAVDNPIVTDYDTFYEFRSKMVLEIGEKRFNEIFGLSDQTVYSWRKRGFRQVYRNLANVMLKDRLFVLKTYDKLAAMERNIKQGNIPARYSHMQ